MTLWLQTKKEGKKGVVLKKYADCAEKEQGGLLT